MKIVSVNSGGCYLIYSVWVIWVCENQIWVWKFKIWGVSELTSAGGHRKKSAYRELVGKNCKKSLKYPPVLQ